MRNIRKYLDLFFKISNFTIIFLYLYPGSILGWMLYGNLKSQPQLTGDFLSLSSNHFYTFLILSFIAVLSYSNNSKKNLNVEKEIQDRINFIKDFLYNMKVNTLVLGLSGGVDSPLICNYAKNQPE